MMPVPGHAFTAQLLRGNPLSSALSWTPNHRWEHPKCFFPLCLLRSGDSQEKEGWIRQPEQGFQKLGANPCSYEHKQFHFILLDSNRFSALFKQSPAAFAQHRAPCLRPDLSPKASHFQPAGFKFCSSLPPSSQWTRSSRLQRPRENDISTHKTGKKKYPTHLPSHPCKHTQKCYQGTEWYNVKLSYIITKLFYSALKWP